MAHVTRDAKQIFLEALEQASSEDIAHYLDEACRENEDLRARVERLLQAHHDAGKQFLGGTDGGTTGATIDQPSLERPGTFIGSYKLIEQIGEGGMGLVFVAEQHEPVRRKVALKLIKPGMDSREVIARFEAERQALALMDHPNIARVFDAGTSTSGRPYFVMELVQGVPITQYCDDHRLMPRERLKLFINVCRAVQHAHQKGIIHRDVKPTNVLVMLHDGLPVVKVIDFGVAKAIGQPLTDRTIYTAFAQMVGTPLYMSPEQAGMSGQDVDTRTDIYSLGVLLYELLTGTTPFDKQRIKEVAFDELRRIIREEEPQKPSTRLSTANAAPHIAAQRRMEAAKLTRLVRGDLDWIVMKALEKDRQRRYDTPNSLADDVERFLTDAPVSASPPSAAYRFKKLVLRNKRAVLAAALILLALIFGVIGTAWNMFRAGQAQKEAVAQAQKTEQERDHAIRERIRANEAEQVAHQRLFQAKLAEAKAGRRSRQPGQRIQTWQALSEAAQLAQQLELGEESILNIRKEAAACLAVPDVQLIKEWDGFPPGSSGAPTFDADLTRYARSDLKGNISVRRVVDDQQLVQFSGQESGTAQVGADSLQFSPDGTLLAVRYHYTVPGHSTNFQLWDWQRRRIVFEPTFSIYGLGPCFSPDGSRLALGQENGTISFHDPATGEETKKFSTVPNPIHIAFSPNGDRLAVASLSTNEVQVWDCVNGTLTSKFVHPSAVSRVSWHPDGVLLAAACEDTSVYLWDSSKTSVLHGVLRGHTLGGVGMAFAAHGDAIVSRSYDATSRLWNPWSAQEELSYPGLVLQVSRDGERLVRLSGWKLSLWNVTVPQEAYCLPKIHRLDHKHDRLGGFSPDGRVLAMCAPTGVRLWDPQRKQERAFLPLPYGTIDTQFHPSTKRMFTSGSSGLHEWPVMFDNNTMRLGPPSKLPVMGSSDQISLDQAGRILAATSLSSDCGLLLDLTRSPAEVRKVFHDNVRYVATSPDGKWIATGTHNGFGIKVWETQSGRELRHLIQEVRIARPTFSPDGQWFVAASENAFVIWRTPHGDSSSDLEPESWKLHREIPTDRLGFAAFSNDGKILAITQSPAIVRLLDPESGRIFVDLVHCETDPPLTGAFSPDNAQIVMTSSSGAVRVWDLRLVRAQLRTLGVDWDLPAYPDPPATDDSEPIKIEFDLGELAPQRSQ